MLNKKKIIYVLIVSVCLISMIMTATYADRIASTHGEIRTEGVDVSISATQDQKIIYPNMTVHYRPVIMYKGVDAYVRFKLDISSEEIELYNFKGLSETWVKRGDYYYYTKPVKNNSVLSTFDSFHIPSDWSEKNPEGFMGSDFDIKADCDAVQAKNFIPDFESERPWGELVIEDNSYDGDIYRENSSRDSESIKLNFKGASQYTLNSDEMIKKYVLPGDKYRNSIKLSNSGDKDMEVFFSVSEEERGELDLLDAVMLKIKLDDKEFYNGDLRAARLNDWRSLVYMKQGSIHKLSYEIYVPAELNNRYEEKLDDFTWNFKVIEKEKGPKTGDTENFMFWLITGICSMLLLLKIQKEDERHEE